MALGTFPDGNYVLVSEVRAEGLTDDPPTNNQIGNRIKKWETIVEQWTGQVFREIDPGELTFDGNNSYLMHFSLPLITVTSVKINGDDTELDTTQWRAFTGRQVPQDDRKNPKIMLLAANASIYTTSIFTGGGVFVKGADQKITATWGYLEPDGECPQPIKDSIIQLVIRDFAGYFDQYFGGMSPPSGAPTQRERTDDHEIEYAGMSMDITADRWGSLIPRDIRAVLSMYKRPLAIRAPEPRRFLPYDLTFMIEAY